MFKDENVLIAGGAGFIGTNLIKKLLPMGANIRATIHKKSPVIKDDRIEYVKCDLTKEEDCRRVVKGMDYVFMCAANTSGAAVMAKTPMVHVTPNVMMNTLLLEAAYEAGESTSSVDNMAYIAYVIFGLVLAFVVIFVIKTISKI